MKVRKHVSNDRRSFITDLGKTLFYSSLSISCMPLLVSTSCKKDHDDTCYSTDDCDQQYTCKGEFTCYSSLDYDCDDYFDCLNTFTCDYQDFTCHDYYYCSGGSFTCKTYSDFDCDEFTCVSPYSCNAPGGKHECSSWGNYSHRGGKGS